MPKTDQDVTIYQNADEPITIAITDKDNNSMDLNSFDDMCWILTRSGKVVLKYTLDDDELIIADADAVDDGLRVSLASGVTGDLDCGRLYVHQAWGTYQGDTRPLCIGYVTVKRGDGC